jgi:hypothetical protein
VRRGKEQRHNYCRPCQAEYRRDHYLANREKYVAKAQTRNLELRAERTALLIEYFESHPCSDCGETDPVVLEFDHLRDKKFNIGGQLTNYPWDVLLAEIEKCEVVCGNCHKRRTARRRQFETRAADPLRRLRTDKGPGEPGPPPCL